MKRALVALATLWLAQSLAPTARAVEPTAAYVGRWAFQVEGRNLFVLSLQTGGGSPSLAGTWMRPQHLSLNSNQYVSGVSLPVIVVALTDLSLDPQGLHFAVQNPSAKSIDRFEFDLTGPGSATLKFLDAPSGMPALTMARVERDAPVAEDWDPGRLYSTEARHADNPEMARLFEADQADRKDIAHIDWKVVGTADLVRQRAVRGLLAKHELNSGYDFFGAAFVFQHGGTLEDHLLAHTLAMIAVKKGRLDAIWIASATLDRYLQETGKPQIYGTQYQTPNGPARTTQEPYDRVVISDALRDQLNVPTLKDQEAQRAGYDKQYGKP